MTSLQDIEELRYGLTFRTCREQVKSLSLTGRVECTHSTEATGKCWGGLFQQRPSTARREQAFCHLAALFPRGDMRLEKRAAGCEFDFQSILPGIPLLNKILSLK